MNVRNRESSFIPPQSALAFHQRSSSREHLPDKHPTAAGDSSKKPESQSSQLLDLYEIELITRELERFIIRAAADKNDESGGRRRKLFGQAVAAADVRGLRGFFARKAVAFCGSDDAFVPEKRLAVRRSGGRIACRGCDL